MGVKIIFLIQIVSFKIVPAVKEKKTNITNNRYSKSVPLARYYDQQLVTQLEAIYNILQIIDERLTKLEQN